MIPALLALTAGLAIGGWVGHGVGYDAGYVEGVRVQKEASDKDRRLESETELRKRGQDNVRQQLADGAKREAARVEFAQTEARIVADSLRLTEQLRHAQTRAVDDRSRLSALAAAAARSDQLSRDTARVLSETYRAEVADGALAERAVAALALCAATYPTVVR